MMSLIILCLFAAVILDMRLLKRLDRRLFEEAFKLSSSRIAWVFLSGLFAVLVFSPNREHDVPLLVLLGIMPLYLIKRHRLALASESSPLWGQSQRSAILLSGALGVVVNWVFGIVVFGLLISSLSDLFPGAISLMGDLVLSAAYSSILIICLIFRASKSFSDGGFLDNVGLRKGERSWVKVVALSVFLGLFFAIFSSYLTTLRQVQPQTPLNDVLDTAQSMDLVLIFLFLAIGIAPLIEEIVFRGYFFRVIKEWLGGKWAIYIIAATFAILHVGQYWGDGMAIAIVALLGLTLTVLRAWSGTTIAGVITHYVYNGGVTIIPIIMIAVSNPAYFRYKAYFPYHDTQTKEALLKESIAKKPDFVDAYNDLAWLYAQEEKNLEAALVLIEKALGFAPDEAAYLDTKAEVLEKLGRLEEAKTIRELLLKE